MGPICPEVINVNRFPTPGYDSMSRNLTITLGGFGENFSDS